MGGLEGQKRRRKKGSEGKKKLIEANSWEAHLDENMCWDAQNILPHTFLHIKKNIQRWKKKC